MDEVLPEIQWLSSPEDQWNLTNLTPKELVAIYPDRSWDSLRRRRANINQLINQGKLAMPPPNPEYDGNPEAERERANARRKRVAPKTGQSALQGMVSIQVKEQNVPHHLKFEEALNEGYVRRATVSSQEGFHQGFIKNSDGEIEYTQELPNEKKKISFSIDFDRTEEQLPVVKIEGASLPRVEAKKDPELPTQHFLIPDAHIGWWEVDGQFIPMHDENVLNIAIQIARDDQPDTIIWNGDPTDFAEYGRFKQPQTLKNTTQRSMLTLYLYLEALRKSCPAANIKVSPGNHGVRLQNLLNEVFPGFNARPADDPEGYPAFSIPNLASFKSLDVEYIDKYPADEEWVTDGFKIIHGDIAQTKTRTASALLDRDRTSIALGHIHRRMREARTIPTRNGAEVIEAVSFGCACDIQGNVPSGKAPVNFDGRPQKRVENWQHGLGKVLSFEGQRYATTQQIEIHTFEQYRTVHNGKVYYPDPEITEMIHGGIDTFFKKLHEANDRRAL